MKARQMRGMIRRAKTVYVTVTGTDDVFWCEVTKKAGLELITDAENREEDTCQLGVYTVSAKDNAETVYIDRNRDTPSWS